MRQFGLIGYPLSHSFSERYFTRKFEQAGITDCTYQLFPIESIELLPGLLQDNPGLVGLNVTIPYKKQVMSYLHNDTGVPGALAACNCIHIKNGNLNGYNTDWIGFSQTLQPLLKPHHSRALILGNGGATAAVIFSLEKMGISYTIVSRTPASQSQLAYSSLSKKIIEEHTIIINTTPLGMYPNEDACPPIPYQYLGSQHLLYDLLYNPAKTLFLQKGQQQGATIKNGEEMLIIQAEESWKIWNQIKVKR